MIQVLHRAISILEFIARMPERPQGLGEIARAVQLNAATCARILKTLTDTGYVEQPAPKRGYILGPMAYALSAGGLYRKDLVSLAEPTMLKLARAIQQPVLLAALRSDRRIILSQINVRETVPTLGGAYPLTLPYQSATGRLLVAYLPDSDRQAFINSHPLPGNDWPEAGTRSKLIPALDRIRAAGWTSRHTGEIVGIAFPVIVNNLAPAALGVFMPEIRFRNPYRERLLHQMKITAQAISARIMKGGATRINLSIN